MYSGNGDQFQWPIAGQATDWASLAAQWINMRETEPNPPQPDLMEAPPPPMISSKSYHPKAFEEQGEAEMDLNSDDDEAEKPLPTAAPFTNTLETIPLQLPLQPRITQPVLNYHLAQYQSPQDWQWPPRVQLPPPVLHIPPVATTSTVATNLEAVATNKAQSQLEKPETLDENKRKTLPAWLR